MTRKIPTHANPRARTERLVVRRLDGEVLVYDRERNRASCLNGIAAAVWERCDGQTSPAGIADSLCTATAAKVDERAVWIALDRLGRAHLLEEPVAIPPSVLNGSSRREFIRQLGIGAAVAIPAVTTILVPSVADAQSCLPNGSICADNVQCCSGICDGFCFPP